MVAAFFSCLVFVLLLSSFHLIYGWCPPLKFSLSSGWIFPQWWLLSSPVCPAFQFPVLLFSLLAKVKVFLRMMSIFEIFFLFQSEYSFIGDCFLLLSACLSVSCPSLLFSLLAKFFWEWCPPLKFSLCFRVEISLVVAASFSFLVVFQFPFLLLGFHALPSLFKEWCPPLKFSLCSWADIFSVVAALFSFLVAFQFSFLLLSFRFLTSPF